MGDFGTAVVTWRVKKGKKILRARAIPQDARARSNWRNIMFRGLPSPTPTAFSTTTTKVSLASMCLLSGIKTNRAIVTTHHGLCTGEIFTAATQRATKSDKEKQKKVHTY